ncbi:MAG: hypothetical protein BWY76_00478 [bacterium ADurb.Bin429]|nr:MAG: hypothetical protein BWY76_00478 [bacterium ADurb.Bin429]
MNHVAQRLDAEWTRFIPGYLQQYRLFARGFRRRRRERQQELRLLLQPRRVILAQDPGEPVVGIVNVTAAQQNASRLQNVNILRRAPREDAKLADDGLSSHHAFAPQREVTVARALRRERLRIRHDTLPVNLRIEDVIGAPQSDAVLLCGGIQRYRAGEQDFPGSPADGLKFDVFIPEDAQPVPLQQIARDGDGEIGTKGRGIGEGEFDFYLFTAIGLPPQLAPGWFGDGMQANPRCLKRHQVRRWALDIHFEPFFIVGGYRPRANVRRSVFFWEFDQRLPAFTQPQCFLVRFALRDRLAARLLAAQPLAHLQRTDTELARKDAREITDLRVTDLPSNGGDGQVMIAQQELRVLQADLLQIFDGREAEVVFEHPAEILRLQAGMLGERCQRYLFGEMLLQVAFQLLPDLRNRLCCGGAVLIACELLQPELQQLPDNHVRQRIPMQFILERGEEAVNTRRVNNVDWRIEDDAVTFQAFEDGGAGAVQPGMLPCGVHLSICMPLAGRPDNQAVGRQ